jgi:hypothetical protein
MCLSHCGSRIIFLLRISFAFLISRIGHKMMIKKKFKVRRKLNGSKKIKMKKIENDY